jgi:hypothetical protein
VKFRRRKKMAKQIYMVIALCVLLLGVGGAVASKDGAVDKSEVRFVGAVADDYTVTISVEKDRKGYNLTYPVNYITEDMEYCIYRRNGVLVQDRICSSNEIVYGELVERRTINALKYYYDKDVEAIKSTISKTEEQKKPVDVRDILGVNEK